MDVPMFNQILVPTDGSDAVQTALDKAFDLASTYDSTVHVVHVVEDHRPVARLDETVATGSTDIMEHLEGFGKEAINEVIAEAEERDITAETAILHGNPSDEIIDYADEKGIDLIVMSTHGRTGLRRALLGSVTENVSRHADVSVLIAR